MNYVMENNSKNYMEMRKVLEKRWAKFNKMMRSIKKMKTIRNGTKRVIHEGIK